MDLEIANGAAAGCVAETATQVVNEEGGETTTATTQVSTEEVVGEGSAINKYNDKQVAVLEMLDCTIYYFVPEDGVHKPYFALVNPMRKEFPLKLYRSAMLKLAEYLPAAFDKVAAFQANYPGDDLCHEVALISKHNNSYVRLVVTTYSQKAYMYVRLYDKKDGKMEPSRYGVRIMGGDSIKSFNDFVASCK